jgi:hypothetical protein
MTTRRLPPPGATSAEDWAALQAIARAAVPAPWSADLGVITGPDGQVVGTTVRAVDAQVIVALRNALAAPAPDATA